MNLVCLFGYEIQWNQSGFMVFRGTKLIIQYFRRNYSRML